MIHTVFKIFLIVLVTILLITSMLFGGWTILTIVTFPYLFIYISAATNIDKSTTLRISINRPELVHDLLFVIWPFLQLFLIFGCIVSIVWFDHLTTIEAFTLSISGGFVLGTIGLTVSHQLLHRGKRVDSFLADFLLGMFLSSHLRTEHLLIHHESAGTSNDPTTAKYDEGFYSFFVRVLLEKVLLSWSIEKKRLKMLSLSEFSFKNPFWRYLSFPALFLSLSYVLGDWLGFLIFLSQALTAILIIEINSYIGHYGLSRKELDLGVFEPIKTHHSWIPNDQISSFLLGDTKKIANHHVKLETLSLYKDSSKKHVYWHLPYNYILMALLCLIPPVWRKVMNPIVDRWRLIFYPEINY